MEQRDFLKDQIEQMGKVLSKILSDFLGLKSKGQVSKAIEVSNEQLNTQLDIDMDKIGSLSKNELADYISETNLTPEHLEILSEYLQEIGKSKIESDKEDAKKYLEKAVELLEVADEISKTMSFERVGRKQKVEELLQRL